MTTTGRGPAAPDNTVRVGCDDTAGASGRRDAGEPGVAAADDGARLLRDARRRPGGRPRGDRGGAGAGASRPGRRGRGTRRTSTRFSRTSTRSPRSGRPCWATRRPAPRTTPSSPPPAGPSATRSSTSSSSVIRLRAAKGGLTVSDRRPAARRGGAARPDRRRPRPPRRADPAQARGRRPSDDAPDPPADVLDPVTRRQIRVALDHLRRRDLYDALGLPRDAPAWRDRRPGRRRAPAVDAEDAGHGREDRLARSGLARPVAPGLARRPGALRPDARAGGRGGARTTRSRSPSRACPGSTPARGRVLLDEAAALGVAPDRAERLIARGCRALGVARDGRRAARRSRRSPGRRGCSGAGRARGDRLRPGRRGRTRRPRAGTAGRRCTGPARSASGRTGSTSRAAPAGSGSSCASPWSATSRPRSRPSATATTRRRWPT